MRVQKKMRKLGCCTSQNRCIEMHYNLGNIANVIVPLMPMLDTLLHGF